MECSCPAAGWCYRHQKEKTKALYDTCRSNPVIRAEWDRRAANKRRLWAERRIVALGQPQIKPKIFALTDDCREPGHEQVYLLRTKPQEFWRTAISMGIVRPGPIHACADDDCGIADFDFRIRLYDDGVQAEMSLLVAVLAEDPTGAMYPDSRWRVSAKWEYRGPGGDVPLVLKLVEDQGDFSPPAEIVATPGTAADFERFRVLVGMPVRS